MINYFKIALESVKRHFVDHKQFKEDDLKNGSSSIRYYNWWWLPQGQWLGNFIQSRNLIPPNKLINLCSVNGYRGSLYHIKGPKLFFPIENLHDDRMDYADHLMHRNFIDLALGYDYFEEKNYLRFPLWICYMFPHHFSIESIAERCNELKYPNITNKIWFATLVSRFDWHESRSTIANAISHIGEIKCPSDVLHNDDSLSKIFNDDKISYIRNSYFNICPENSNSFGYVTEKIFEAISAGCIPIYWGSYNNPEPGILNKDAIIFWDFNGDNSSNIQLIAELYKNPKLMDDFLHQPRLMPNAEDLIFKMVDSLESKIRNLYV